MLNVLCIATLQRCAFLVRRSASFAATKFCLPLFLLLDLTISRFYCILLMSTARSRDEVICRQVCSRSAISAQEHRTFIVARLAIESHACLTFRKSCRGMTSTLLLVIIGLTVIVPVVAGVYEP